MRYFFDALVLKILDVEMKMRTVFVYILVYLVLRVDGHAYILKILSNEFDQVFL